MPGAILSRPFYIVSTDCGYCGGKKADFYAVEEFKNERPESIPDSTSSITIGSQLHHVNGQTYEELINKGFRRSGTFLYKPDMLRNCCRYYTIRTNMSMLKLSKQQRKYVNRFCREIADKDDKKVSMETEKPKKGPYDLRVLAEAEAQSSRFHTRFEPSEFSPEKFELYKKYQIKVHNDKAEDISKSSFKRFLCTNPFLEDEASGDESEWRTVNSWTKNYGNNEKVGTKRIGPTHECYYLDGKLIAISVLDFLPTGVSSVYFIWDPDYANLSLGTISGLREILLCKELGYTWYYLGYYIDDCPKMKYKSQFGGQLLDLCNATYFPIDMVKEYIKNGRLFVLAQDGEDIDGERQLIYDGNNKDYRDSSPHGSSMKNVVSSIYSSERTYKLADEASMSIMQHYDSTKERISDPFQFPTVIPGVIPLPQLSKWVEEDALNNIAINSLDAHTYKMHRSHFRDFDNDDKLVILDCIRIFGLQLVEGSIIVM